MTRDFSRRRSYKGSAHPQWKGGRKLAHGYWLILKPDHPHCNSRGYIFEHRLRMEEYLGRYLTEEEEIHHLDMNKENNRIGNLMLFATNAEHKRYEMWGQKIHKKDMSGRLCLLCGGKTHIDKKGGWEHWHKYRDDFICKRCYDKQRYL